MPSRDEGDSLHRGGNLRGNFGSSYRLAFNVVDREIVRDIKGLIAR
jgi:hypothetical protein